MFNSSEIWTWVMRSQFVCILGILSLVCGCVDQAEEDRPAAS